VHGDDGGCERGFLLLRTVVVTHEAPYTE
jgi:hypothetical protein